MTVRLASGIALRKWAVGLCWLISAASVLADTCFDDTKLVQAFAVDHADTTMNAARTGLQGRLLYVWSPRMVLSAQHAASAQRQAVLQGLQFVALHDAGVPEGELRAALERLELSGRADHIASAQALSQSLPLCSSALLDRDALRHFPTAFVQRFDHRQHRLHHHTIIGAMPESAWASSIAQRLHSN